MNISIFYEKQDIYKSIKDLTYHIGNVSAEIKDNSENRADIDIAAFTYSDAKYIRREIQVNNEEIYYIYVYISAFEESIKELEYSIDKLEGLMQSKGLETRRANYREDELLKACLPFFDNPELVKEAARRNILTSGLVGSYPFLSSSIFDDNGVFIGKNLYNDSLVFINKYDDLKYKNANMCIFGTSGAGKSFYVKLLAIRYKLLGITQYIIDPERGATCCILKRCA